MLLSLRRLKKKPFINDEENRISITSLNFFVCSFVPSNLQFKEEVGQTNIFGLEVLYVSFQAEGARHICLSASRRTGNEQVPVFRAKLKTSVSRLVNILFPELESLVPTLHMNSVYRLLQELPGAYFIASSNLTRLKALLADASKGHYGREKAIEIRETAKSSIGSLMPAKSMELRQTIRRIDTLTSDIKKVEQSIQKIMDECGSPITTIPGIKYRMGAMILAEIGDFTRFSNADQVLAYAGLSPSTYQSRQLISSYARMEKRGSKYLRYALFNAAIYDSVWDERFRLYLSKKRAEGKHYYVAISHVVKKLVRTIFRMEITHMSYQPL